MTVAIQPICIIIGIYREETLMTSKMEIVPDDGTTTLFTVSERLGMHFFISKHTTNTVVVSSIVLSLYHYFLLLFTSL